MTENEDTQKLQGAFGDKGTKKNALSYFHPETRGLLKKAREMLTKSFTGLTLWKVSEVHDIPIKVLKGKGDSGYSFETNSVFVYAPPKATEPTPKMLLDLCQGLRLAEQHVIGFTAPDKSKDLFTYASIMHAKNLDSIAFMCKVVYELRETSFFNDLLDEIEKLGHGGIYQAYIRQASDQELIDEYAKS